MLTADLVTATGIAYVGLLFLIAYVSDRQARRTRSSFLRSPFVYTLAISVYCTSWTFYGAVGSAARNGLEYMAIYLGPTLVFIGWWFILRRLVRISHNQRITSIADLLSSRFGKSSRLAVLVTVIAVIGIAPYIALQLKAVTSSIQAIAGARAYGQGSLSGIDDVGLAFGVAAGMALFTVLFGTRNVDAKEQHHGVVAAIAFEAVVKLAALLAVGLFAVFAGGGFEAIFSRAEANGLDIYSTGTFDDRWLAMNVLSIAAIICLPRQFQITVVENSDESHLRTAAWAFPGYLLLMSIFTLPIALYGLTTMPAGANPDMFVLTLPLAAGQEGLALFAFIGGFSSATSMIIVESIALSIMVSNHIVMPIVLRFTRGQGVAGDGRGVSQLLLYSRRFSIGLILSLGFSYFYLTRGSDALAPIGLISFCGVAQFLPAIVAALFWKDASLKAATASVAVGFVVWAWSSFMPSFESASPVIAQLMAEGPWGIAWLRPEALFGLDSLDPLANAVFWSLFLNTATLVVVSLFTSQSALERVQATLFVDLFRGPGRAGTALIRGSATSDDLRFVAQRVLGIERATALFTNAGAEAGTATSEPTPLFIDRLERELAGSIGAASAHVMLGKVVSGGAVSLEEVLQMADETQQVIEHTQELERTSIELRDTARKLEEANRQLRELDSQKDEFLSQVSHEVRTPMTSIRSFSEILLGEARLDDSERRRFLSTIYKESLRLTKLLDQILDINNLEHGEPGWRNVPTDADAVLDRAVEVCTALALQRNMRIVVEKQSPHTWVDADADRLNQVLINLISNAIKYNDADQPMVEVRSRASRDAYIFEVADNGSGIPADEGVLIFEKFARGTQGASSAPGAGLGLTISRQIISRMNGKLELVPSRSGGACFRITLPPSAHPEARPS